MAFACLSTSYCRSACLFPVGLDVQLLDSGIFGVFSGANIRPHSQWNLDDFFSPFLKKYPNLQKKLRSGTIAGTIGACGKKTHL